MENIPAGMIDGLWCNFFRQQSQNYFPLVVHVNILPPTKMISSESTLKGTMEVYMLLLMHF